MKKKYWVEEERGNERGLLCGESHTGRDNRASFSEGVEAGRGEGEGVRVRRGEGEPLGAVWGEVGGEVSKRES